MRNRTLFRLACAGLALTVVQSCVLADNQEKSEKKALEQQAKNFVNEAKVLEKSGKLLEARTRYANSQAFTDSKDALQAIKRIDGAIQKRVKEALRKAHQLYDQGKFKAAADAMEQAATQVGASAVFSYNLALCYQRLSDTAAALGHLDQAALGTADPKKKLKIRQLRTAMVTGESAAALKTDERDRIVKVNQMIEAIGFDSTVDDGPPALQQTERSNITPAAVGRRTVSLCQGLTGLKAASSPAITFNLANCAESNDRSADAAQLLGRYLQLAPQANDVERVRLRIERLKALAELPGSAGVDLRRLSASASRSLEVRKYDTALADFQKAANAAPDFAPAEWRLALMYESMGNVKSARQHFERYRTLEANLEGQRESDLHLETLETKRTKYDEEVDRAWEILSDLFNRAMNLTFNGLEDRTSQYKQRAKERARNAAKHKVKMVGGFAIPFAYAQQQLSEAGEHLAVALILFPLGVEANQLMGLVLLQAGDGHAAMRAFDAVLSQNLPAAFYAELRGRHKDHAVKCELTREGVRLIILSSYDKKAKPTAPAKPAGEDGLGDLYIDPASERGQEYESISILSAEIKKLETKNGHLLLKLAKEDLTLSPIYLPAFPPSDGPAGRRFGNTYTRLFVRYPGLEQSKLGAEGLTAFESIKLGYDIANAAYGIAGSLNPFGAIGALETFVQISREVHSVSKSLRVTYAAWIRTLEDQQDLQAGNAFKAIPTEATRLAFVEELK